MGNYEVCGGLRLRAKMLSAPAFLPEADISIEFRDPSVDFPDDERRIAWYFRRTYVVEVLRDVRGRRCADLKYVGDGGVGGGEKKLV